MEFKTSKILWTSLKRKFKTNIMKKVFSSFLLLSSVLLFSCTKEKDWLEVAQEGAVPALSFGLNVNNPIYLELIPGASPTNDTAINVFFSGTGNGAIDVNVTTDNSVVDAYNLANMDSIQPAPPSTYTFPGTITIPAGSQEGTGILSVNIADLTNFGTRFAIGLTISNPGAQSGGKSILIFLTGRNKYDGLYTLTGATSHPTNPVLTGPVGPYTDIPLVTVSDFAVVLGVAHPWANGSGSALPPGYEPTYTIHPDNSITVTNPIGAVEDPTYNNHYDPATQTIYAQWFYLGTGGNRVFTDTLVYTGPR